MKCPKCNKGIIKHLFHESGARTRYCLRPECDWFMDDSYPEEIVKKTLDLGHKRIYRNEDTEI